MLPMARLAVTRRCRAHTMLQALPMLRLRVAAVTRHIYDYYAVDMRYAMLAGICVTTLRALWYWWRRR